jgi:hypothetical protein
MGALLSRETNWLVFSRTACVSIEHFRFRCRAGLWPQGRKNSEVPATFPPKSQDHRQFQSIKIQNKAFYFNKIFFLPRWNLHAFLEVLVVCGASKESRGIFD